MTRIVAIVKNTKPCLFFFFFLACIVLYKGDTKGEINLAALLRGWRQWETGRPATGNRAAVHLSGHLHFSRVFRGPLCFPSGLPAPLGSSGLYPIQPNAPGPGVLARESREPSGLQGTLVKSDQLLLLGGLLVGAHSLPVSNQC